MDDMSNVPLSRRTTLLVLGAVLLALLVGGKLLLRGTGTAPLAADPVAPTTSTADAAVAGAGVGALPRVVVDVVGEVRRPGLYRLGPGARVADAVARAGGPTRRAQVALVNLAAPLADGEQVVVPRRGEADAAAGSPNAPLDLNTASAEQLDALPGIGPVTAQKIIDYRQRHGPFTAVAGLDAIPGIGPARIANLQGLVVP
jgi:competence protein ComEA